VNNKIYQTIRLTRSQAVARIADRTASQQTSNQA